MGEPDDNSVYLNIAELIKHEKGSLWVEGEVKDINAILCELKNTTGEDFGEVVVDWIKWFSKNKKYEMKNRESIIRIWDLHKKEIEFVAKIEKLKKKNK